MKPTFASAVEPGAATDLDEILSHQRNAVREQLAALWESKLDGLRLQLNSLARQLIDSAAYDLDRIFEERFEEVERQIGPRIEQAASDSAQEARRAAGNELNQAVRRLRDATTPDEVTRWLLDVSAPFCPRAAVFAISGGFLEGLCARGLADITATSRFESLDVLVADAPAFGHAVRDREPVTAIASESQVSRSVVDVFGHAAGEKVYLFPLAVRGEAAAVLYVSPGPEPVEMASIELLTQIAAIAAETMVADRESQESATGLVQIGGSSAQAGDREQALDWASLPPDEQEFHLMARRFARVHVAEIRLYHADQVTEGRSRRRLYSTLQQEIDGAREVFRQKFVVACPSMVDYLHLELVRSLANDNASVLGRDYPGPLI